MLEGIGRKVAAKFGEQIAQVTEHASANERIKLRNERVISLLRQDINKAVSELNNGMGQQKLQLRDEHSGLSLYLHGQLTLHLFYEDGVLDIIPSNLGCKNLLQCKADVLPDGESLSYAYWQSNPNTSAPMLSQETFVEGLIKIACGQPSS